MFLSFAMPALLLAAPPAPFEFSDGDRVVWLGGTLVEREQRYGYWETALLLANPGKKLTIRNLGWSGDTVHGEARGRFDFANAEKCFRQIVEPTLALKPTVILICYGTNESFEGPHGVVKFEKGLEKLLDALKPANARIVLISPTPFEKSPALPDPTARNESLGLYRDAMRRIATKRNLAFVDLMSRTTAYGFKPDIRLTENGLHLTEAGYLLTAPLLLAEDPKNVGLWADTVVLAEPLEKLRRAVIAKNELFFHRWRPQNETYLFGFRKHEQGQNAKEVAEFDPLVAKAEEEIDQLRKALK
jgi:lysophospholipase L1-like esterase